jgi:hypothetical protein
MENASTIILLVLFSVMLALSVKSALLSREKDK